MELNNDRLKCQPNATDRLINDCQIFSSPFHPRFNQSGLQSANLAIQTKGEIQNSVEIANNSELEDLNKTITEEDDDWTRKQELKAKNSELGYFHIQNNKSQLFEFVDGESISDTYLEHNDPTSSCGEKSYSQGRWSAEEHSKFMEAMLIYGNEWRKIHKYIQTRSSAQIRSHAQKFFLQLKKFISEDEDDTPLKDRIIHIFKEKMSKGYLPKNFDEFISTIMSLMDITSQKRKQSRITSRQKKTENPSIKYLDETNMKKKNNIIIKNLSIADDKEMHVHEWGNLYKLDNAEDIVCINSNAHLISHHKRTTIPEKIFIINKVQRIERKVEEKISNLINIGAKRISKVSNNDTKVINTPAPVILSNRPKVNSFVNQLKINLHQDMNQEDAVSENSTKKSNANSIEQQQKQKILLQHECESTYKSNNNPFNINFDDTEKVECNLRDSKYGDLYVDHFFGTQVSPLVQECEEVTDFDRELFFNI